MAYNRRQQRRPGIRYGPPHQRERFGDNGVLIGRLLGLGVLLLSFGVLTAGALAFMGDLPGSAATPARSNLVADATAGSTSIAGSPTPGATSAPRPTPSPLASVEPTAAPSHVPPLVQIGEGFVTFGTRSDQQLHILDPRSTFTMSDRIVWSAFLTSVADSIDLHTTISKIDLTAPAGERVIADEPIGTSVRGAQIFQRRIRPESVLEGPGVYAVRYLRDTDLLAEGFLEIVE